MKAGKKEHSEVEKSVIAIREMQKMYLHEEMTIRKNTSIIYVLRVVNGWIYSTFNGTNRTQIFVPDNFHLEEQSNTLKEIKNTLSEIESIINSK